jgi:hypothetical protein
MDEQRELTSAEKHYLRHKEAVKKYTSKNRDVINERNRQHYKNTMEDPDKKEKYLQKKRDAYAKKKST